MGTQLGVVSQGLEKRAGASMLMRDGGGDRMMVGRKPGVYAGSA
jgi:hypothetical protein